MTVKQYMIPVYAVLMKGGHDIESLLSIYILPIPEPLSLKGKELLSLMLSLPGTCNYTLFDLTNINADGVDGIRTAVNEPERYGYLTRLIRNDKGQLFDTKCTIHEHPVSENPTLDTPIFNKPTQREKEQTF